jgi:transposase
MCYNKHIHRKDFSVPLNSKLQVSLPEKGIIVRSSGQHRYVYKVMRTFRNEKGQPTNSRRLIGKLDIDSGMLIPNGNYYKLYENTDCEILSSVDNIRSIGATFLVDCLFNNLGVSKILNETFGASRASTIATAATYMVCRGNIFEHVLDWCTEHTLNETPLTSQKASSLFSSITHADKISFFKSWIDTQKHNTRYLAYDVTSFSSYAEGIEDTEWGYNRDRDKLPQINLGCYTCEERGLPMFYVTYPGSIVDKSHLPYMMAYNAELGIQDVVFVMDKGFCSTSNLNFMHTAHYRFIAGVEMRHKSTRAAIDEVRNGIVSMRNHVNGSTYARAVHARFYGVTSTMHIFYDTDNAERQRKDLYRRIEAQEELLGQLSQITERDVKKYSPFFDIKLNKDGSFNFSRSYEKIDNASNKNGFFCLLSNADISSAEILSIYRKKDVIEKGFDDLKNHIDMKRMHTHTSDTTDGKMFCAFIALIATSGMTNAIRNIKAKKTYSKYAILSEMDKIKMVTITDGSRIMNPLTKTQRMILEAFGITEGTLKAYLAAKSNEQKMYVQKMAGI